MIRNTLSRLKGKTNANTILGFPPGILYCVETHVGGGFAGTPERLVVVELEDGPNEFEKVEFPKPSPSVEYSIGGRAYGNYNYHTYPDGRHEPVKQKV